MSTNNFSGNVLVELQGDAVLEYLETNPNNIRYSVIGFDRPKIFIEDQRPDCMIELHKFLESGNPDPFLSHFNANAYVEIFVDENGDNRVILQETVKASPEYILWIAVGIGKFIPAYDYRILESTPINEDQFSIFSLYQWIN